MENWKRVDWYKLRAWFVHLYTSLGLITGFLAILAMVELNAKLAFFWMGMALIIDATDGTLARKFAIQLWTPHFDGRKLDDITDYLNYAFLPVFFIWRFELVTGGWLFILAVLLLASVYGFCQSAAKTDDGYFTGFPNFWNVMVLYLFTFAWPTFINTFILLIFTILVFVPFKFVSFSTPGKIKLAKGLALVYFLMLVLVVIFDSRLLALTSLMFPVLYFGYAIFLRFRWDVGLATSDL
jgi:phosphatidylcholine synthase